MQTLRAPAPARTGQRTLPGNYIFVEEMNIVAGLDGRTDLDLKPFEFAPHFPGPAKRLIVPLRLLADVVPPDAADCRLCCQLCCRRASCVGPASLLRMAQVPSSYWGDPDPRLWFEMTGCEGRHYLVDGTAHIRGRMYAYCPVKQIVTRVSKREIIASSDEAGYFMRGFLSGSEPPPPTDAERMIVEDQVEVDRWLRGVEARRQTGEWPRDE
jgi:hypothetical protein